MHAALLKSIPTLFLVAPALPPFQNPPFYPYYSFRFLERAVYEANGVEPIAWKLDPSLKDEALSTGWLPFATGPRSFDGEGSAGVESASKQPSP